MSHPNEQLIEKFYSSLARRDPKSMAECYHKDVVFSDPVFQNLHGDQARAMWQMLVERGKDMQVVFSQVKADDQNGSGYWEATYTFSATGRRVLNKITSHFTFKDGLIIKHQDHFDLWKWAGMALGTKGKLLGWLPPVQASIRKNALNNLASFQAKQSEKAGIRN